MRSVDILEWTMGWAWPVIIGLVALMVWGVMRLMGWEGQNPSEEQTSCPLPGRHCICQCSG